MSFDNSDRTPRNTTPEEIPGAHKNSSVAVILNQGSGGNQFGRSHHTEDTHAAGHSAMPPGLVTL